MLEVAMQEQRTRLLLLPIYQYKTFFKIPAVSRETTGFFSSYTKHRGSEWVKYVRVRDEHMVKITRSRSPSK